MKWIKFLLVIITILAFGSTVNFPVLAQDNLNTDNIDSYTRWFSEYVKNLKVGYTYETRKRGSLNGQPAIITTREARVSFKRAGSTMNIVEKITYFESPNRKPLKFESISKGAAANDSKIEGIFNEDSIEITSTNYGNVTKTTIPLEGSLLLPYGIDYTFRSKARKSFAYRTIIPSLGAKVVYVDVDYVDTLPTDVMGNSFTLNKYKVNIDAFPSATNYEWRDDNGISYKTSSSILNSSTYLTDEDRAKKEETGKKIDLIEDYAIIIDKAIPDPREMRQVLYKVALKEGSISGIFPQDERQKVIRDSGNELLLRVEAYLPDYLLYTIPFTDDKFIPYLKGNNYIQPGHPEIAIKAKQIIGRQKNAYLAAKELEKWVSSNIKDKTFDVGLATASEVIEDMRGDCTEHAILLASLCRAVGIPSQIVVGLVYVPVAGSDKGMFMYHMWNEVYVGKWIQLDSALPGKNVADATHITITKTTLNNPEEEAKISTAALSLIGNLELDIITFVSDTSGFYDIESDANLGKTQKYDLSEIISQDIDSANIPLKSVNLDKFKGDNKYIDSFNLSGLPNVSPVLETYEGNFTKGMANYARGDIDKSIQYFKNASKLIPPADAKKFYDLGIRLAGIMMFDLAEQQFEKSIQIGDELWSRKAKAYLSEKFPSGNYNEVAEKYNVTGFSFANFASNYPAAILMFEKAIDAAPKFDSALYNMAVVNEKQRKYNDALGYYKRALNVNPRNVQYNAGIAGIYEKLGQKDNAIDAYQKIINYGSTDKSFLDNIKFNLARVKAEKLIEQNKNNTSAYIMLGEAALENDQFEQAKEAFIKALSINKNIASAHTGLGKAYFFLGNTRDAEDELKKAIRSSSAQKEALLYLGIISKRRLDYKEAINYISRAISLDRNNNQYHIELGKVYMDLEDYKKAINTFSKATNAEGSYMLGLAYFYDGQQAEAIPHFKKAISLDPYDARAYKELGKIYLDQANYIDARNYIERAVDLDTNYADAYYVLGLLNEYEGDKVTAAFNFVVSYSINQSSVDAYKKAYEIYKELDELDKFNLPRPRYIPTKEDREYLIRLLYLESIHIQDNMDFVEKVLNFSPNGFVIVSNDVVGKTILKKAESEYLAKLRALYNNALETLKPPPKFSSVNQLFLNRLWTEANFHHKQLHFIDVGIFGDKGEGVIMNDELIQGQNDILSLNEKFYSFVDQMYSKWDSISVDEITRGAGFRPSEVDLLTQKVLALQARTDEAMQRLAGETSR
jgi:tetratricopeptide (TPR) repeat protein/transglutaminase-like putative cysteine protease